MRIRFAILLLLFGILATLHSSLNPLFESSDEFWHIGMAVHLARGGGLPIQQPGVKTMWRQEGSQPPLYYGWLAWLTRLLRWDLSDFEQIYLPNPHAYLGNAAMISNRNQILHGPWEAFPWRGSILTLHLWRGISIPPSAGPSLEGNANMVWRSLEGRRRGKMDLPPPNPLATRLGWVRGRAR